MIQEDLKSWLERGFEDNEISKSLSDCAGDKAPGLDGFNFTVIKSAWDIVEEHFCRMLSEFHSRGKFNKRLMLLLFVSFL